MLFNAICHVTLFNAISIVMLFNAILSTMLFQCYLSIMLFNAILIVMLFNAIFQADDDVTTSMIFLSRIPSRNAILMLSKFNSDATYYDFVRF